MWFRIVGSLAATAPEITHDESARFFPGEHFSFSWICAEGRMFGALAVFWPRGTYSPSCQVFADRRSMAIGATRSSSNVPSTISPPEALAYVREMSGVV